MKFILGVRNPVERVLSEYYWNVSHIKTFSLSLSLSLFSQPMPYSAKQFIIPVHLCQLTSFSSIILKSNLQQANDTLRDEKDDNYVL